MDRERDVLWKRAAPKGPLSVSTPKVRRQDNGTVEVKWTTRGRVEDSWVRVSSDKGKTWRAAATGIRGTSASLNASHLPAGKVTVEVVVHNGFRSTASKPVSFENAVVAPVPAILHPDNGCRVAAGGTLYLWGSIAEQEGMSRDDFRYTWTIDGKPAGDGLHVFTHAPEAGDHVCELNVLDAKGKRAGLARTKFASFASDARKA